MGFLLSVADNGVLVTWSLVRTPVPPVTENTTDVVRCDELPSFSTAAETLSLLKRGLFEGCAVLFQVRSHFLRLGCPRESFGNLCDCIERFQQQCLGAEKEGSEAFASAGCWAVPIAAVAGLRSTVKTRAVPSSFGGPPPGGG